jgi:hypothetical protein
MLIECILVGGVSFFRLVAIGPFSGHALIIIFYILHQIFNDHFKYVLRIVIGLVVLTITVIFKFFLWNDPMTFLMGVLLGVIFWIPGYFIRQNLVKKKK